MKGMVLLIAILFVFLRLISKHITGRGASLNEIFSHNIDIVNVLGFIFDMIEKEFHLHVLLILRTVYHTTIGALRQKLDEFIECHILIGVPLEFISRHSWGSLSLIDNFNSHVRYLFVGEKVL